MNGEQAQPLYTTQEHATRLPTTPEQAPALANVRAAARTAAHDLNNALAPITGFAELLTLHPTVARDPTLSTYAKLIYEAGIRAVETVGRLQRVLRKEQGAALLEADCPVLDADRMPPSGN